jgi:hypothetical protein
MLRHQTLVGCLVLAGLSSLAFGEEKLELATFEKLHRQIKPQAGESRWMEIPWLIDLHEAREKAAAAGKPIFVMSGGGATAIGPC